MVKRFETTNIRSVLSAVPPGTESEFWDPLVWSLLNRKHPIWDFFPSQKQAIKSGLLNSASTFSLQMPTGAGKTALAETLLFYHLKMNPDDAAVLLVPLRSLASELRGSLAKRLDRIGLPTRCVYGGTVPIRDGVRDLADTRVVIATPEALSGLLSANLDFYNRITLVICDEGHLLDEGERGVGLERLLSRMRARRSGSPRFVFMSAIVPNIEEINVWLGGRDETVVRSDYRPTYIEFAVLRVLEKGRSSSIALQLHPHETEPSRFLLDGFLSRDDFQYMNPVTGRRNTYVFNSVKTRAIAVARKSLSLGAVAVFCTTKKGHQGAVGLVEELLSQLENPLPLPTPMQFVSDAVKLRAAVEYFGLEYGPQWIGTKALATGAVLHHGSIPQESREVVEALIRHEVVRLFICTSTLAEGINLPIRTLVLYSVQRRMPSGRLQNMLTRNIKNLVGRAGRAGKTTKGLVICANPNQWSLVEPIARQQTGERVVGALYYLMNRLRAALRQQSLPLTNENLEDTPALHTLIDGIDSTLIDLATEELEEEELVRIAGNLSSKTFAAQSVDPDTLALMRDVFVLRARRVAEIKSTGRLGWIRETGTRARMLAYVEASLLPLRERWDDIDNTLAPELVDALLKWTWDLPDTTDVISDVYRGSVPSREDFMLILTMWLEGRPILEMATCVGGDVGLMLEIHARILTYVLQITIEQGICLLRKFLKEDDKELSQAVVNFPEHLRFGVPTPAARVLARRVRHRRAAVALGQSEELQSIPIDPPDALTWAARELLNDRERWIPTLGTLVLNNTIEDLSVI
ncbi:DEAD/DEAH box helicase [bacterium]|nr:DEAD/DEAH box helicase [bacterium]